MSETSLVVVGPGRVGLSLAADLAETGRFHEILVLGRRSVAPAFLAGRPGIAYRSLEASPERRAGVRPGVQLPAPEPELDTAPEPELDCLIFCVPDDRLSAAAREWCRRRERGLVPACRVALHTSGLHPASVLESLRSKRTAVGSWHPLVALAGPREGAFRDATIGLEGEPAALRSGERLAEAVGARTIRVDARGKGAYHLAAVFASNHLVACLGVALRELRRSGATNAGLEDLLPLARSALDNLVGSDLATAATGPVARGDVGTVERHLESLDPADRDVYRGLALELLRLAKARLTPDSRAAMERLLADRTRGAVESAPGK
ncbi:MAG: Rossmann-like and DUF2520 domain-containing protein [Gemmatimonadota bacterium]